MIRTWFKRASWTNRLQFLFLSIIAFPVGLFGFIEFAAGINASTWPIRAGDVVARTETNRWIVFPSSRLSILLENDGPTVHAVVAGSEGERIPNQVRVHYSGNPDREVRIDGEESPWWGLLGAVLLWLCPLVVLWLAGTWPDFAVG
ncbi:MAG: hypothetical protein H8E66_35155 [Planctomycetes bacterium]|nr:hypothetical protein [Planctomycetota bacterium]